jgi:hypothetical protein
VLVGVDHSMAIMRKETFGPAVAKEAARLRPRLEHGPSVKALQAGAAHDQPSVCYGDPPLKHY